MGPILVVGLFFYYLQTMLTRFVSYLRYELNRSVLTVEAYSHDINSFAEWLLPDAPSDVDYSKVTLAEVRSWLAYLSRKGDTARTLRRKSQSLRALFRWMQKEGIIHSSPMRDLPLPKIPKPLPDMIRPKDIEAAIESIKLSGGGDEKASKMTALILEILYTLGIRRAELVALNDSDISFSKGEIKVTGKRSKQRVVPAPMQLLDSIKEWQKARDEEYGVTSNDSPLFVVKGERIKPEKVYHIVRKALEGTAAKKKSPHALRHSFASGMLNGGADIDSVREFLGHSSLATTQIYTHISLREIRQAYAGAHPRMNETKK